MKSLTERWQDTWKTISQGPAEMPFRLAIPRDHVEGGDKLGKAIDPDEHYFQVRVNEMYLTYGRRWFSEYDPMVFVVSEFTYDKKEETVPFVVGPMMLEKFGQKIPTGMIFADTRVAGLHPYRGGRLALALVLCRVKREDYARKLLQIVEGIAGVLDFSTALSTYLKVGHVVLDGVEALLGSGDTHPLIGFRKEFDPDAGEQIEPSYFAIIDLPEGKPDANEFWVSNNQLRRGRSLADAKPFRDSDFVLYSITQTPMRRDLTTLPFYPLYERVIKEAMESNTSDRWNVTKGDMSSLAQTLRFSPDLTPKQAKELREKYTGEMVEEHERAVAESPRAGAVDSGLREVADILNL